MRAAWYKDEVTTVYAIDIRRRKLVRINGVVHYAGAEALSENSMGAKAPWTYPYAARCGVGTNQDDDTPAYLGDDEDIVVTCVACLGDRRRG